MTPRESARRLTLLKAAFREVAERGFSNVTLQDVARRAGVSKGVPLYYFDSKEVLLRDLFAWLIDSIHLRMREAVDAADGPVEKVRALVALIFPSPSKNRAFFRAYVDFCGLASRRESFLPRALLRRLPGDRPGNRGRGDLPRSLPPSRRRRDRVGTARDLRRPHAPVARGKGPGVLLRGLPGALRARDSPLPAPSRRGLRSGGGEEGREVLKPGDARPAVHSPPRR